MSGTRWFFAFLLGFGLLSYWVTSLREKPAPLAPLQTEISETVEPQEEEIPLQVIEHTVLRDWKPIAITEALGWKFWWVKNPRKRSLSHSSRNWRRDVSM